ncbi:hypothetical protein [Micromonospora arida]|uniref:Uncharacterized protein n=1 Tax=Micromonospora arida TaxID=2203715 RepID=A0A3N9Y5D7_9ACTN|nr:hypothetical protein [Micromonospora arida]RQX14647.1 hypothetical protein DLJ58_01060 [Micromonospora arida]
MTHRQPTTVEQDRQAARARKARRKHARREAFERWEAGYAAMMRLDAERANTRDRLNKGAMISPATLRYLGIRIPAGYVYAPAEQPEPTPAPQPEQPEPQPVTPAPVKPCAHCGEPFPVKGSKRYCSGDCRVAARPLAPPAKGSMRDRPHRTLLGSK